MKRTNRTLTCVALLSLSSAIPDTASAAWTWRSMGTDVLAYQAVADYNYVYAVTRECSGTACRIKKHDNYGNPWVYVDQAAGSSIAIAQLRHELWLVGADNRVYERVDAGGTTPAGWYYWSNNRCEGGTLQINQALGNKNLAVGMVNASTPSIYVIDNRTIVRSYNFASQCWQQMSQTPDGGFTKDIQIYTGDSGTAHSHPIVVTSTGNIYWHTGSTWKQITGGTGLGLGTFPSPGTMAVIGSDGTSVWWYGGSGFTRDNTWTHGALMDLGTMSGNWLGGLAVTATGIVYWNKQ